MERGSVGTALIGPNALLREALVHILSGADFEVLASAPHIDDSIVASLPQDPTLLIIEASGGINAIVHQIETFKSHRPAGRVVVLAHQLELPEIVLAFSAGANAYLVSVADSHVFIKSIELVMLGETILPPSLLNLLYALLYDNENAPEGGDGKPGHDAHIADGRADNGNDDNMDDDAEAARVPHLSARQRLILRCLIIGDSNKTIARKIHIAEATVKVHVKAILRKIRVHNRTQAAFWAMNNRSFIPAKDNQSSAVSKLSVQPFPNLTTGQVSPSGGERPPPSTPEFEIGDSHDDSARGEHLLVEKDIERKYD